MKINVNDHIYLSPVTATDQDALIKYLNDPDIFANTLLIPSPYTEADAKWWINHLEEFYQKYGIYKNWAIRTSDGAMIGAIGIHYENGVGSTTEEIGYWLAQPFRNKGIMSEALKSFCQFCFTTLNLEKLEAPVFDFNKASGRVLEKAGFKQKGFMKDYYRKNGKFINAIFYYLEKPAQ